jgi:hypothetical protein
MGSLRWDRLTRATVADFALSVALVVASVLALGFIANALWRSGHDRLREA